MINQHYLDNMFPRGPNGKVLDDSEWANTEVDLSGMQNAPGDVADDIMWNYWLGQSGSRDCSVFNVNSAVSPVDMNALWPPANSRPRVKDLSRLWAYRNGGSPTH